MYYVYGVSEPSLLTVSTDSIKYPANQTVQPSRFQQDYPNLSGFVPLPDTDGKNSTFEIHLLDVVND